MTNADRLEVLWQLYQQLDAVITSEEMEAYPFMTHLADLISDLEDEE
ncbi:hypothetical protein SynWH8101_0790 [Synechococcus sp. WH 8101]|nr:hypothetical protein [Synechococcus sp. WH 8101]QBE68380.1 hypothetical protein SynWH8101_0790 [Synechococcus sp. WH 8101]